MTQTIDPLLEQIARKHLRIETLQERHRDELDFHDVGVIALKNALQEAFDAGVAFGLVKDAE